MYSYCTNQYTPASLVGHVDAVLQLFNILSTRMLILITVIQMQMIAEMTHRYNANKDAD